eukprot:5808431-Amphidinium_carterae.1
MALMRTCTAEHEIEAKKAALDVIDIDRRADRFIWAEESIAALYSKKDVDDQLAMHPTDWG